MPHRKYSGKRLFNLLSNNLEFLDIMTSSMAMFSNNIDIPLEIKRKIEYFIFFVKIKKNFVFAL